MLIQLFPSPPHDLALAGWEPKNPEQTSKRKQGGKGLESLEEASRSCHFNTQLPAPRNPIPAPGCQQGVTSGEHRSVHQQHTTHPLSLLQRSNTPILGKSEAQFRDFLQGRTEAPNPPRFWGGLFPRSRRKMKSSSQNSSKEKRLQGRQSSPSTREPKLPCPPKGWMSSNSILQHWKHGKWKH